MLHRTGNFVAISFCRWNTRPSVRLNDVPELKNYIKFSGSIPMACFVPPKPSILFIKHLARRHSAESYSASRHFHQGNLHPSKILRATASRGWDPLPCIHTSHPEGCAFIPRARLHLLTAICGDKSRRLSCLIAASPFNFTRHS
jgi:hypothetical protein